MTACESTVRRKSENPFLDDICWLLERGGSCTPLKGKQPIYQDWLNREFNIQDLEREVTTGCNLGLKLGKHSAGWADIDLDCPESRLLAPSFLPATAAKSGRASSQLSHWFYRIDPPDFPTTQFIDPVTKSMLYEFRGTGAQTMVPPSIHPCGERVEWAEQGDPTKIELTVLMPKVCTLAAATLLTRHWPEKGYRHQVSLPLAGALLRNGWSENDTETFIYKVAWAAGDEEAEDRQKDVRSTVRRLNNDQKATGGPTCSKIFGTQVWDKVCDWLNFRRGVEWPEPIPLDNPPLPPLPPYLLDSAPWLAEMIRCVASTTETPVELAALNGLGTIAAAVQKKALVQVRRGYCEPLNIYANAALESGNRKTAVMELMTRPLYQWEREQADRIHQEAVEKQSLRDTAEARIKELRSKAARAESTKDYADLEQQILRLEEALPEVPKPPQLWAQDVTPETLAALMADNAERMAIISDEGGIFDILAGRYSNGVPNLDLFLKAHAGSSVRVNRGSRPPVLMNFPALTLVLSTQPDLLSGLASKPGFRGRGLLARFLYMLPTSLLGRRGGNRAPITDAVTDDFERGVRALLNLDGSLRFIELDEAAYEEWLAFYRAVEKELRDGGRFEFIRDWAGKLPGAAIRIAGNLHCAKHAFDDPGKVKLTLDTMQRALEFAAVLSEHALAVFDLMGADPALKAARKLWSWIDRNQKPQFTFRDAHQALRGSFPRAKELDPAFDVLIERNYICQQQSPTQHRPGRQSKVYEVNPCLTVKWGSI